MFHFEIQKLVKKYSLVEKIWHDAIEFIEVTLINILHLIVLFVLALLFVLKNLQNLLMAANMVISFISLIIQL